MTVFRSSDRAPGWCELESFEIVSLARDASVTHQPSTRTERLLATSGTIQLHRGKSSLLLKEAQFIDIRPEDGPWTATGAADASQFVRLSGHWGAELGGCGIFHVRPSTDAHKGDPVSYPKNTAIDPHYHDCDEYWIVLSGTGEVMVGGTHSKVGPGDCLCIGMGHHHDFPLVDDHVKAVFFETTLQGLKRTGHLWNHTHGQAQPQPERI
jgi:mannose-6-phosphate isomerase-like protein (cupin superfamily)